MTIGADDPVEEILRTRIGDLVEAISSAPANN